MTDHFDLPTDDAASERVLHVVSGYDGFHLVSPQTLEAAIAAQAEYEAAPYYEDFGELRRAGQIGMLVERLESWDISVDDYVAAIERSAGRTSGGLSISERLEAVGDVDFDGDDDANAPDDTTNFRPDHEIENEVEDHFAHTLETGMADDVPDDILQTFDAIHQPMFSTSPIASVQEDRLEEMIEALQWRGYTIVRD